MKPKLFDQLVEKYSKSTEQTYYYWAKNYILFHNKKYPKDIGKIEIEEFLTHLVVKELNKDIIKSLLDF